MTLSNVFDGRKVDLSFFYLSPLCDYLLSLSNVNRPFYRCYKFRKLSTKRFKNLIADGIMFSTISHWQRDVIITFPSCLVLLFVAPTLCLKYTVKACFLIAVN